MIVLRKVLVIKAFRLCQIHMFFSDVKSLRVAKEYQEIIQII